MIEYDIRDDLLAVSAIATAIGTRFRSRLQQDETLPAVTYQRISTRPIVSHDGMHETKRARIQLEVWAKTRKQANEVALLIIDRMNVIHSGTRQIGDRYFDPHLIDNYDANFQEDLSEAKINFRHIIEYEAWYTEGETA